MDDPWYDIGGGVPQIGIKIKDPICGITRSPTFHVISTSGIYKGYKLCHSNNQVMSIKMQDLSFNYLPQMQTFPSIRSTPFMKISDKGGEIVQIYESFGKDWDKEVEFGHRHKQRGGATLKDVKRYESFGKDWDKEVEVGHGHKQRGGATLKDVKGSKFLN